MVALLDACAEPIGRGDREADFDFAAAERARLLEARVTEDGEHRGVVGQHLGDEAFDAGLRGTRRELLEEARRRAAALQLVGDGEGDLSCRGVAQPRVLGERDDSLVACSVGEQADQRAAIGPVRIEVRLHERLVDAANAVKAEVAAVLRQMLEECDEGARIAARGRPQPERRAVTEDHVHRDGATRSQTAPASASS